MIPPGKMVIDASVAVKWYLPEVDSERAAAILERGDPLVAPDLLVAEFGNVLWKKVRGGELNRTEAEEIVEAFTTSQPVAVQATGPFLRAALDIATGWQITAYDALYLALALAESCPLVTADQRLGQRLEETDLGKTVLVLSDL